MIKETFRTDDEGYLLDPAEWSEAIAGMRRPRVWSTG